MHDRPLGLLMAWLEAGREAALVSDHDDHISGLVVALLTRDVRRDSRHRLARGYPVETARFELVEREKFTPPTIPSQRMVRWYQFLMGHETYQT